MGNRRFAQAAISDDEDESPRPPTKQQKTGISKSDDSPPAKIDKKRKKITVEDEEDYEDKEEEMKPKRGRKGRRKYELEEEDDDEDEELPQEDAKPIGKSIRFSGKGRGRRSHYEAFEFDGNQYNLEDPVLLVPEDKQQKPYVAIIKLLAVRQMIMIFLILAVIFAYYIGNRLDN